MGTSVMIRMASETDAEEILKIYSPYVMDTAITFEYEVPSVAEFAHRIKNTLKKYPYIVALNDCIAYTSNEDRYLKNTSTVFHQNLGYSKVAHFTKCGYKFGKWYDMIWMEKLIGEHRDIPARFISITEI